MEFDQNFEFPAKNLNRPNLVENSLRFVSQNQLIPI